MLTFVAFLLKQMLELMMFMDRRIRAAGIVGKMTVACTRVVTLPRQMIKALLCNGLLVAGGSRVDVAYGRLSPTMCVVCWRAGRKGTLERGGMADQGVARRRLRLTLFATSVIEYICRKDARELRNAGGRDVANR
jgi:hypothetical protein